VIWILIGGIPLATLIIVGGVAMWRQCPEAVVFSVVLTTIVVACALAIGFGVEQVRR
jgi:hypothetical protein